MKRDAIKNGTTAIGQQPITLDVLKEKYLKEGETSADDIYRRVAAEIRSMQIIRRLVLQGDMLARQGAMVAYTGNVQFFREGAGLVRDHVGRHRTVLSERPVRAERSIDTELFV